MKGIIITEKNYNFIASKVKKFFENHPNIEEWHTWRGGMKKRISKFTKVSPNHNIEIVNHYGYVSMRTNKPLYSPYSPKHSILIIELDNDSSFAIREGMEILFLSNRIIIKEMDYVFHNYGCRFLYTCYQISNSSYRPARKDSIYEAYD